MFLNKCLLLVLISGQLIDQGQGGNVGIGFSTNVPCDVPLAQMKTKNMYIFKTWDLRTDLLDQMQLTFAKVCTLSSSGSSSLPRYAPCPAVAAHLSYRPKVRILPLQLAMGDKILKKDLAP